MTINKPQRELIKIYLLLFVAIFTIINWNTVSWMFNYRVVSTLAYDFFNPYEDSQLLVGAVSAKTPQQNTVKTVAQAPIVPVIKNYPYTQKDNSIELPALGIVAPLIIGQSTEIPALEKNLDKGVVYYPGSVLPGQPGQIVVLGHSAPTGWPKIKYDWVFSKIESLQAGDQVLVYFNNRQYTYLVKEKSIIEKGQDVGTAGLDGKNNMIVLVSCWPPGKDAKRIAVYAQLE